MIDSNNILEEFQSLLERLESAPKSQPVVLYVYTKKQMDYLCESFNCDVDIIDDFDS